MTGTLRYFGRCSKRSCRHRRVIAETSSPQLRRMENGQGREVLVVLGAEGRDYPLYWMGHQGQVRAMRDAGFVCPEHDVVVYFTPGDFRFDPTKVCDARCMGASGPACSCSCGGKNHGANFA